MVIVSQLSGRSLRGREDRTVPHCAQVNKMAATPSGEFENYLNILLGVKEKSTKLRGDLKEDITTAVSKLREIYNNLAEKLISQDQRIKDLQKQLSCRQATNITKPYTGSQPYAEVLKSQTERRSNEQRWKEEPKQYNIIVKAKNKQSPDYIKTLIKSKINPTEIKVGVSTLKPLRNGNLLIQSASKSDADVICSNINNKCGDELEASGAKLRNPRLIIYNVPDEIQIENASEAIMHQNTELDLKDTDIVPKFLFKDKRNDNNLVIEVNSETRKKLLGRKIKIGWNMCTNEDYIKVNRCFKCNKFNHRAKDCTGEITCPFCAGNHNMRECTATKEQFRCINCINFNNYNSNSPIDDHHSALDKDCSSYKVLLKKYILNTNY